MRPPETTQNEAASERNGPTRPRSTSSMHPFLMIVLLTMLMWACNAPTAGEPVPELQTVVQPVPFRGTLDGQLSFIPPFEPGSLDRCNANTTEEGENPGAFVSGFDRATGQWTHLGHTRILTTFCLDPETGFSPPGEGTMTAADGDRLFIVFANETEPTADPNIVVATGWQEVVGGTGRFEGASGVQSCSFEGDLRTLRIHGGCEGTIRFDASNRRANP